MNNRWISTVEVSNSFADLEDLEAESVIATQTVRASAPF